VARAGTDSLNKEERVSKKSKRGRKSIFGGGKRRKNIRKTREKSKSGSDCRFLKYKKYEKKEGVKNV